MFDIMSSSMLSMNSTASILNTHTEATPIQEYPQRRLPWQWMGPEAVSFRRPSRDSGVTESWGCNDVVSWIWWLANWYIYIYIYIMYILFIMLCILYSFWITSFYIVFMYAKYVSNKTNNYIYMSMKHTAYYIVTCYYIHVKCLHSVLQ